MRLAGDFLIVIQNDEITSGIAIDAAPAATYLWTFIVPTYDDLPFLHMSLGKRIEASHCDNDNLVDAYEEYRSKVGWVQSTGDLLEYLDQEAFPGEYAVWVHFIANAYLTNFSAADNLLNKLSVMRTSRSLQVKINRVRDELQAGGWPAIEHVLAEWSENTKKLVTG